jgi:hypothetical protein
MAACVLVDFACACAISVGLHAEKDKKRQKRKGIESRIRVSASRKKTDRVRGRLPGSDFGIMGMYLLFM